MHCGIEKSTNSQGRYSALEVMGGGAQRAKLNYEESFGERFFSEEGVIQWEDKRGGSNSEN